MRRVKWQGVLSVPELKNQPKHAPKIPVSSTGMTQKLNWKKLLDKIMTELR